MGQYGQIKSIIINRHSSYENSESSVYICYQNVYEASIAILVYFFIYFKKNGFFFNFFRFFQALDQFELDGKTLKAFYGSSKYFIFYFCLIFRFLRIFFWIFLLILRILRIFNFFYRYCLNFLNSKPCLNKGCLYLHDFSDELSFHKVINNLLWVKRVFFFF